jgi:segregation and condensation protein B
VSAGIVVDQESVDRLSSALESLLMVAGRPLRESELISLLQTDERQLQAAISALSRACAQPGRGIRVQRLQDQVQLVSAPENARYVAELLGMPSQVKLTSAATETLAVVAFRQPVTRSQIEFIRGVNSDRALTSLLQYGLVLEVGRASSVGRPALFGTTADFLQQFGLPSLDALPLPGSLETATEAQAERAVAERAVAARQIRRAVGTDTDAAETDAGE